MPVLRNIVVFLLGVGAAAGAYMSGVAQRVPDYFSGWTYGGDAPVVTTPAVPTPAETPVAAVPVGTTAPTYETAPGYKDVPGYKDGTGYDNGGGYPGYNGGGYNGGGYPGYKPDGPVVEAPKGGPTPLAITAANGATLKVNIVPDPDSVPGQGVCVVYAVTNRTGQPIFVSLDTEKFARRKERGPYEPPEAGLILQPGETKIQAFAGFEHRRFRDAGYPGPRYRDYRDDRYSHGDPLYRGGPYRSDAYDPRDDRFGPPGARYAGDYRPELVPCARIEVTN